MGTEAKAAQVADSAPANGDGRAAIEVRCPADGSLVGQVPDQGADEVAAIAAELRAAQPEWEALGPERRAEHLIAWLNWIMDNDEALLDLVQREAGKSWGDTAIETMMAVEVINYYAKHGASFLADRSLRPHGPASLGKKLRVYARPHQLVGIIFPWNYPLGMPMMDVPGALMAGAAVLTKPSEFTPLAWQEVVRGWREEIGAPPVIACATGGGGTGEAVIDEVDMIQFTGSSRTGRRIAVKAAERLIPYGLELGGKDAMIVLSDADLERAAGGAAWGGLFNAGQSCIAVERVYVERPVHDDFVARLVAKAEGLRVGMDTRDSFQCDYGAMANDAQIDLVERQLQDAVDKGAEVVTGGKRRADGLFFEPTVLVGVDHTMECMREETFGPLIPVMAVADENEAIRLANDSRYGLSGSVWTESAARGERVGRQLETGAVNINNAMISAFQFPLPMGGWGESGVGFRFGGANGVVKFTRQQAFVSERVALKSELHWYPYTRRKGRLQGKLVRLLGAHGLRRRLGRPPRETV